MSQTTIGILHPGAMGVTVGASAATGGARALWSSEGRSTASVERATSAGLSDAGSLPALAEQSAIIVSVCPPHAAEDVAHQVAATGFAGIYVDGNAIAPQRARSIQERVDLVHTHGVVPGKIDLRTFVDACSTGAAKAFKMFPRKGALAVGSDADLVIYDPAFVGSFSHAEGLSQVDYCGFEGMPRQGRAAQVLLRGQVVARDGKFVGREAGGQYISR
mgnify:CR=1 FL=1